MLWKMIGFLLLLWLVGLIGHLAGNLIHVLPVIAIIMMIVAIESKLSAREKILRG